MRFYILTLTSMLALTACGGGGETESNAPPQAAISIPTQEASEKESFSLGLPDVLFNDPNGDAVTVSLASGSPTWLTFSGGQLLATPPEGAKGTYAVQLEGRDAKGATSSIRFELRVGLQHERYFTLVEEGFPALYDFYAEVKSLWNDRARGVNADPIFFDANGDGKLDVFINVCRITDPSSNITGPSFCRARYFEFSNGKYVDQSQQKLTPFPLNFGGGLVYLGADGDFNGDGRPDLVFGTGREDGRPKREGGASQGTWAGDTWSLMSAENNKLKALFATNISLGTNALRSGPVIPSLGNESVIWFQSDQASDGTVNPNRYSPTGGYGLRWNNGSWQLLTGAPNVSSFPIFIQYDQAGNVTEQNGSEKVIIAPNSGHNAVTWTREGFSNSFNSSGKPLGAIAVSSRNGSQFTFRELALATSTPPIEVQKAGGRTAQVWRYKDRSYVDGIFEESCSLQPSQTKRLAVFRMGTTLLPASYNNGILPDDSTAPSGFYQPLSLYFAYEYRNQRLLPVDLDLKTDDATYQLECYDINGDGFEDISLQGFRVDGRPLLYLNNGQGTFRPLEIGRLPPLPEALRWQPKSGENHKVYVRDFNGDKIADLLSIPAVFVDPANWQRTGLKPLLYLGRRPLPAQP